MYVFLVGLVALLLFGMYQVLDSRTVCLFIDCSLVVDWTEHKPLVSFLQKRRIPVKIEKGTGGISDVDISWIPQETLNVMSMSFFFTLNVESFCLSYVTHTACTIWLLHPALQTKLPLRRPLRHPHGNEPRGRPGLTSRLLGFCPSSQGNILKSLLRYKGSTFLDFISEPVQ